MTNSACRLIVSSALAAGIAGCAGGPKDVVFVTKTSFALDVAAQPAGASIGYDRVEGYIGPRRENGDVPPVAASFVTNGRLLGRQVRQVYATGKAAEIVTAPDHKRVEPDRAAKHEQAADDTATMFFNTGTTIGLKLGFGSGGVTDWVTLGYKRREISLIPITKGEFPAVLATIESDQDATSAEQAGFGVGQYFATGLAAQSIANDDDVRSLFRRRIQNALPKEAKASAGTADAAPAAVARSASR